MLNFVGKTTSEHIIPTIEEGVLTFKGNGYYHLLETCTDENGDILQFRTFIEIPEDVKGYVLNKQFVAAVYDICNSELNH